MTKTFLRVGTLTLLASANLSGCKFFQSQSKQKSFTYGEETLKEINIAPLLESKSVSFEGSYIENPTLAPDFVMLLEKIPVCYVRTKEGSNDVILETQYPVSLGAVAERTIKVSPNTAKKMAEAINGLGEALGEKVTKNMSSEALKLAQTAAVAAPSAAAVAALPAATKSSVLARISSKRKAFGQSFSSLGTRVSAGIKNAPQKLRNLKNAKPGALLAAPIAVAANSIWGTTKLVGEKGLVFCKAKPFVCPAVLGVAGAAAYAAYWINSSELNLQDVEELNVVSKISSTGTSNTSIKSIEEERGAKAVADELLDSETTDALVTVLDEKKDYVKTLENMELENIEEFENISAQLRILGSADTMGTGTTCEGLYAMVAKEADPAVILPGEENSLGESGNSSQPSRSSGGSNSPTEKKNSSEVPPL